MAAFNRLRSQIADEILRRLSEVSTSELSIPVGTLTGSTLLAGRGPCIRVRMQAVGSADASLTFGNDAYSLAGATYEIRQCDDDALAATVTTDATGRASCSLRPGVRSARPMRRSTP